MASSSSWFVLGEDEEGQGEEFNPQWNEGCFCAFSGGDNLPQHSGREPSEFCSCENWACGEVGGTVEG